jgi:hypothetical protein
LSENSEDWLIYAQRLSKEKGKDNKAVQELFLRLAKESKDLTVKDSALMWVKMNIPGKIDNILW